MGGRSAVRSGWLKVVFAFLTLQIGFTQSSKLDSLICNNHYGLGKYNCSSFIFVYYELNIEVFQLRSVSCLLRTTVKKSSPFSSLADTHRKHSSVVLFSWVVF